MSARSTVVPITRSSIASIVLTIASMSTASAQVFNAKPGAWETTVTTSGMTIPPEMLAKMSAANRAAVEQRMAAIGSGKPQVRKSCVSQADLQKGFVAPPHTDCTVTTVSRTTTKLVTTTSCTAPVPSSGTMTWEAKTPESVLGVIDQDAGGRKIHVDVASRWLGADCTGIAPLAPRR